MARRVAAGGQARAAGDLVHHRKPSSPVISSIVAAVAEEERHAVEATNRRGGCHTAARPRRAGIALVSDELDHEPRGVADTSGRLAEPRRAFAAATPAVRRPAPPGVEAGGRNRERGGDDLSRAVNPGCHTPAG